MVSEARFDLLDLMPTDTPSYMAPAWIGCLSWAIGEKRIIDAYREETGDEYIPSRIPIEQMIDETSGRTEAFIRSFVKWFNESIWGRIDLA